MERITFEGNFCDIAQCRELPCKYDGNCTQKEVWERLKAYEDSGCEPGLSLATANRHEASATPKSSLRRSMQSAAETSLRFWI